MAPALGVIIYVLLILYIQNKQYICNYHERREKNKKEIPEDKNTEHTNFKGTQDAFE